MTEPTPETRSVFATLIRDPIAVALAVITVTSIVMIYRTRVRVAYGANVMRERAVTLATPQPLDAGTYALAWPPIDGAGRYRVDAFDARLDTIVTIDDARSPLELRIDPALDGDAFYTVQALDGDGSPIARSACGRIRREPAR